MQIACNLNGDVAAIGQVPVHGARHDAYAFEASGLKDAMEKSLCADDPAAERLSPALRNWVLTGQ